MNRSRVRRRRSGSAASGVSAGYRFGTTRTVQPGVSGSPPPARWTSGGVRSSWPSRNGSCSGSIGSGGVHRQPAAGALGAVAGDDRAQPRERVDADLRQVPSPSSCARCRRRGRRRRARCTQRARRAPSPTSVQRAPCRCAAQRARPAFGLVERARLADPAHRARRGRRRAARTSRAHRRGRTRQVPTIAAAVDAPRGAGASSSCSSISSSGGTPCSSTKTSWRSASAARRSASSRASRTSVKRGRRARSGGCPPRAPPCSCSSPDGCTGACPAVEEHRRGEDRRRCRACRRSRGCRR